jgi:hypothetical protein
MLDEATLPPMRRVPNPRGTPESLAKARAARAKRLAQGGFTFAEAFDTKFKDWFDGPTWQPWRTVGKAIFGEPMTAEELAEFQSFTGRTLAPTTQAREVWMAIGRRAGKDWFCAAVIVYIACYRKHAFKVGDLARVMLLAVDMDQASESFRYICELIDSIPECAALVKGKPNTKQGMLRLTLKNRIEILVKAADKRRVRGRTAIAIVASEIAFWTDQETHQNPAIEVLRALRPSMLGVPDAILLAVSSPYRRKGVHFDMIDQHWAKDGDRILALQASTMAMRPDTSEDFLSFLEEEQRLDPVSFDSEYRANFRKDLEDFVTLEQVQAVIVPGRAGLTPLMLPRGTRFLAFLDAAGGGGQDSAALSIAALVNDKAVCCRVAEWRPPFSSVGVAVQIAEILGQYGIRSLTGDNFSGATWRDILLKAGVGRYVVEPKAKSDLYRDLIPALNGQLVELLDPKTGPTQARVTNQLLALERSASRGGRDLIAHPRNGHDDVINAVAGSLLLALRTTAQFAPISTAWNSSERTSSGTVIDAYGTRHLGGDTFRAANGTVFHDPRGL